jgi:hypothetical protein
MTTEPVLSPAATAMTERACDLITPEIVRGALRATP